MSFKIDTTLGRPLPVKEITAPAGRHEYLSFVGVAVKPEGAPCDEGGYAVTPKEALALHRKARTEWLQGELKRVYARDGAMPMLVWRQNCKDEVEKVSVGDFSHIKDADALHQALENAPKRYVAFSRLAII